LPGAWGLTARCPPACKTCACKGRRWAFLSPQQDVKHVRVRLHHSVCINSSTRLPAETAPPHGSHTHPRPPTPLGCSLPHAPAAKCGYVASADGFVNRTMQRAYGRTYGCSTLRRIWEWVTGSIAHMRSRKLATSYYSYHLYNLVHTSKYACKLWNSTAGARCFSKPMGV
jgi:hypothetical protein